MFGRLAQWLERWHSGPPELGVWLPVGPSPGPQQPPEQQAGMWKSTASWARGTEGNTAETGGAKAYKKRLSFPPVHGFGEWSVKQCVTVCPAVHALPRLATYPFCVARVQGKPAARI